MIDQGDGGAIVLHTGPAAFFGAARQSALGATSAAIVGLVRSAAIELRRHAIRVNAIAPSLLDTPLGRTVAGSPRMAEAVANLHPIMRLGTTGDIAAMGELLLTEAGSWITGQVIGIDGGRSRLRTPRG